MGAPWLWVEAPKPWLWPWWDQRSAAGVLAAGGGASFAPVFIIGERNTRRACLSQWGQWAGMPASFMLRDTSNWVSQSSQAKS